MKIYIAGKISGDPEYKVKFARTKRLIRKAVKIAFRGEEDFTPYAPIAVLNPAELPTGMAPADYMRICLSMIDSADAVIFQPSVTESKGAQLELLYCEYVGKPYGVLPKSWEDQDGSH